MTELNLVLNVLRANQTHHLNKLQRTIVPKAIIQLVPEGKKNEDYLPYIVMAAMATLALGLGPTEQNIILFQTHSIFI